MLNVSTAVYSNGNEVSEVLRWRSVVVDDKFIDARLLF